MKKSSKKLLIAILIAAILVPTAVYAVRKQARPKKISRGERVVIIVEYKNGRSLNPPMVLKGRIRPW